MLDGRRQQCLRRGRHRDRHRHHDDRLQPPHPCQRGAARGARGPGAARGRGGAAALRPRPARPARPQPLGDRAQGRARRPPAARPIPRAAADHVADMREVARAALGEVRDAVSGYRQPTLAGELAGARAALEAAGIAPQLDDVRGRAASGRRGGARLGRPRGDDERDPAQRRRQLPHRRAARARTSASAEISDDGRGSAGGSGGHGLAGLRERVEDLAGQLEAGTSPEGGFRLRVTLPIAAAPDMIRVCSPRTRRWCARRSPRCSASRTTSRSSRRSAAATRSPRPRARRAPTSRCSTSRCPA